MSLTKLPSDIQLGTGKWLTFFYSVNSVVPHSSAAGVAVAWDGVQAPPDHLYHKFYVMYIRVINIEPPSGGMNAVLLLLPGWRPGA